MSDVEKVLCQDASFECGSCESTDKLGYAEIGLLVSGGAVACKACSASMRLGENDNVKLSALLDGAAGMGKFLVIVGTPFFAISLVLVLIYGAIASIACIAVGLTVAAVINMRRQSVAHAMFVLEGTVSTTGRASQADT